MGKIDYTEVALVLYSHDSYSDLWEPFLSRLQEHVIKHLNFGNIYFFVNDDSKLKNKDWFNIIRYEEADPYTTRLEECFANVKEEFCIFMHEDMIPYRDVSKNDMLNCLRILNADKAIDFIKFMRSGLPHDTSCCETYNGKNHFYKIPDSAYYNFVIQPMLVRTNTYKNLTYILRSRGIWQFEKDLQELTRKLGIKGVFHDSGSNKRGEYHWDSTCFPYIATAVFKGKWTTSEYPEELEEIFKEFKIDKSLRGEV